MINLIISEKGGAERREGYSQTEISIGRVKGNDVLLPKGNVSKRHARLIFRDGRYIVTDLKSTNGTYVNHRRITHATLVREGDRIYIGDFVLRIDGGNDVASVGTPPPTSHHPFQTSPESATSDSGVALASSGPAGIASLPPMDPTYAAHQEIVSHFPIEHDPDDSSPLIDVPGPPPMPGGLRPMGQSSSPALSSLDASPSFSNSEAYSNAASSAAVSSAAVSSAEITGHTPAFATTASPTTGERMKIAAHQRCLEQLVLAVEAELEAGAFDTWPVSRELAARVVQAIDQQLGRLAESTALPADLGPDALREAARRELCELGPLGPLLEDDTVTEIRVLCGEITVSRHGGQRSLQTGLTFSNDRALARLVARLCGSDWGDEPYLERPLAGGRSLFAVRPPASPRGHLLVIRQPRRALTTLNSLVRSGALSRGMATLLAHAIGARINVLVVGLADADPSSVVEALAHAQPRGTRAVWLQDGLSALPDTAAALDLGVAPASQRRAVHAAAQLAPEHLIAPPLAGEALLELCDAVTAGTEGVVLQARASTIRQAWTRLAAEMASHRPGLTPDTAREWLASSFELGLEVTRLRDNRVRVARLCEFRGGAQGSRIREVFTFAYHRTATGGSIEGSFYASGTVPRFVEDLAARGMPLDTTIFRRHPTA